jgi:hypothetical protein
MGCVGSSSSVLDDVNDRAAAGASGAGAYGAGAGAASFTKPTFFAAAFAMIRALITLVFRNILDSG